MMVPKTMVIKVTDKQRKNLIPIFEEYACIKKSMIYETIISHGIAAIYRKHKWELKKEN